MSDRQKPTIYFVTADGVVKIRMRDVMTGALISAARDLKAQYLVAAFDWDVATDTPLWSVYEMAKAAPNGALGQASLPVPVKTFSTSSSDAPVMYAVALMGGQHG